MTAISLSQQLLVMVRVSKGLSQRKLAAALDVSPSELCRIKAGHRAFTFNQLVMLAGIWEGPLWLLLREAELSRSHSLPTAR